MSRGKKYGKVGSPRSPKRRKWLDRIRPKKPRRHSR